MRIDAYMQVNQLYQASKPKKADGTQKSSGASDKFEISSFGKVLQIAKQAVSEAPDVRMDKVNELKESINSGNYDLSMDRLAEKLTDKYFGI
jgi:negative regulator of flagellin synthesis FlgM